MYDEIQKAEKTKTYAAYQDFGHTSSNTKLLVDLGFCGLIKALDKAESKIVDITDKQRDFYNSSKIVISAMQSFCKRLSLADGITKENADCLENISKNAPSCFYEALQILVVYFYLHEYIAGTRMRTLGRLDDILYPLYEKDIKNQIITKDDAKKMLKYFLNKFWTMKVPYDLPFCLGGVDANGEEITNELSYMIVEAYNELNIHSPKIHIRVSDKTPKNFIKLVLDCIREGNSSFVFANDDVVIKAMTKCGATLNEARNYVFIGCYEPAIFDLELPCTGNGEINLPKMVELVFCNGRDFKTGELIGVETGVVNSYEEFVEALKKQISYCINKALTYISTVEKYYMQANPDPILSAMLSPCIENGKDAYDGGAKYNNSSFYINSIATLTDSVIAVKKLVFDEKRYTFFELGEILKSNWKDNEELRLEMSNSQEKYGNNIDSVDSIAVYFADFCAKLINGKPNGRGGIFKAANFSIDFCFPYGAGTMATPDGRYAGEPNSKNLCAVSGKDKKGITGLINTVTKMDLSDFPNGSVLDFVLHPSAVSGDDGLDAFYGILKTYFKKGGMAMHGNVFDAEELKKAQQNPEKYANLQVRVCGWNVFFVNLSKAEQDAFIKQAENRK